MLPLLFVLLSATNALALPTVAVSQYNINEVNPVADDGRIVSSYLTNNLLEYIDGGDLSVYMLANTQILDDLADQSDSYTQAVAVSQTLAILGVLSAGVPGDSCEAAAVVNEYASGESTGASRVYLSRYINFIDIISELASDPHGFKYSSGPRGNCIGAGRSYQFEAAWDGFLKQASPYTANLMQENYCATKRLYQSPDVRSNNFAAAVTAATVPSVVKAIVRVIAPVTNFLKLVISGAKPSAVAAAAAVAKQAISQC